MASKEERNIEVRFSHFILTMISLLVIFMGVAYSYGMLSQKVETMSIELTQLTRAINCHLSGGTNCMVSSTLGLNK